MTIRESFTASRSQSGWMHCCETRHMICSGVPPEEAFKIAEAASFFTSKEACASSSTSDGMRPCSMTCWIWSLFPAVML